MKFDLQIQTENKLDFVILCILVNYGPFGKLAILHNYTMLSSQWHIETKSLDDAKNTTIDEGN